MRRSESKHALKTIGLTLCILFIPQFLWAFQDSPTIEIVSSTPENNARNISSDATISLTFTQPIDGETISTWGVRAVRVIGEKGGVYSGTWTGQGTETIVFTPDYPFFPGDKVSVETRPNLTDETGRSALYQSITFDIEYTAEVSKWEKVAINGESAIDGPRMVDASDIDGDGDLDVAIASRFDNTIRWMENDGSGIFTEHIVNTSSNDARSIVAADLDLLLVGTVDLISGSSGDRNVRFFNNDGEENLSPSVIFGNANGFRDLAVADMDLDGDIDVVTVSIGDDRVRLLTNNGFQEFEVTALVSNLNNPNSVSVSDINKDGYPDIVITSFGDNNVTLLTNNQDGSFTRTSVDNSASGPVSSSIGELNKSNDYLEIVVSSFGGGSVFYYEFDGSEWNKKTIATELTDTRVAQLADINADGNLDIIASASNPGRLVIYENQTNGFFQNEGMLVDSSMSSVSSIEVGDFTGNGVFDFIVADIEADSVFLFKGDTGYRLTQSNPEINETGVELSTSIALTYNADLDASSIQEDDISLWLPEYEPIEFSYEIETNGITITPESSFPEGATVHVYVSDSLKTMDGEPVNEAAISFSTLISEPVDFESLNWNTVPETRAVVFTDLVYANQNLVGVYSAGSMDIQFSSDSQNWDANESPAQNEWSAVAFGKGTYIALGKSGSQRIMYSSDGQSWELSSMPGDNEWEDVIFAKDRFVAVSRTGEHRAAYSFDGVNWESGIAPSNKLWENITYGNGLFVALESQRNGAVMTSRDGISWNVVQPDLGSHWQEITYGNGKFVAIGISENGSSPVMYSTDGSNWEASNLSNDNSWYNINAFKGGFVAYAYNGEEDRLIFSSNGIDWTSSNLTNDLSLLNVYVIGDKLLSRTNDGLIVSDPVISTSIDELNNQIPNEMIVAQNYPNPFNPTTRIKFGLKNSGPVSITVYDFLGRKVNTLLNESRSAGWHEVTFDAYNLASGMYFYKVEQENQFKMGKMLLIK